MATQGRHMGAFSRYEGDPAAYRLHEVPFAPPPPPMPPLGVSLPLSLTLRPPSPHVDEGFDTSPSKKNSRYLREMDRRTILARLDRGEKQSALAKEFRVTRAAICNLNKHRDLVLSRQHEDPPKEDQMRMKRKSRTPKSPPKPAERLIPLLLSRDTTDSAFRRYCDRLMTMEVLAWAHAGTRNNAQPPTPCGVSIAPGGSPMLSVFQALEPELPTGHIKLSLPQGGSPVAAVLDLPASVASHSVCLFYAFTDAVGGPTTFNFHLDRTLQPMAPSDRLTNSPPPPMMLNHVEKSDFQMCLHARQPFIRYESHRRRPNSRIPSQGHVTKLPGVAALLRRHDAMQAKGLIASTPVPVPEHDFECWTPPRFAGTLSDNTASPKSRWTPLTAALETNPQTPLKSNWSSNTYRYESKTQQTWVAGTPKTSSPAVVRSPEPVRTESRPKTSRYLREIDRRRILLRIAQGEKQSALAKEYHVSRAAICNLNKHRAEVLSRNHEHPLAKHPKRRMLNKPKRNEVSIVDNQASASDSSSW
ncbi:hypothetical protein PHYSODRAFT_344412 [Phytophthora sojae]|uniref:HTH psq-type domain-containing protein n=1 Tax=Phytophthora sojae (strain P6497) TaxID=1094619 RepID=G4YZ18_PHYSP|nr:hypothetical protein PHYSODRAFT_344412 [Phytophthora sojae]EGZ23299.1 hypothetical protein PHYSODRAFT_344412 [Phytophthora sojae]|eukprot:XP_009518587.1 hypothetical protein PHYSODRAFT_344412 [Phytophthora sojae]